MFAHNIIYMHTVYTHARTHTHPHTYTHTHTHTYTHTHTHTHVQLVSAYMCVYDIVHRLMENTSAGSISEDCTIDTPHLV